MQLLIIMYAKVNQILDQHNAKVNQILFFIIIIDRFELSSHYIS